MPTNCYRTSITRPPWKVALISTSKEKSFNAVSVIGSGSYTVLSIMCSWSLTQCLHFTTGCTTGWVNTTGCTTGWVNDANEPSRASLQRSIQDAYDVIRLTHSKADVWTVIDDVARLIEIKKRILIYLVLTFTIGSICFRGTTKIIDRQSPTTKLYKTQVYLLYKYSKRFVQPVVQQVVQPVVQPAAKCKRPLRLWPEFPLESSLQSTRFSLGTSSYVDVLPVLQCLQGIAYYIQSLSLYSCIVHPAHEGAETSEILARIALSLHALPDSWLHKM